MLQMIEQSTKVFFFSFRVPYLKNDRWILRDGECAGFRYSNQNIRTKDRNGDDLNMFHIRDSDTSLPERRKIENMKIKTTDAL